MCKYVRACLRLMDISLKKEWKTGKRKEAIRCENGNVCSHCGINNKAENVRNNPRKNLSRVGKTTANQRQTCM